MHFALRPVLRLMWAKHNFGINLEAEVVGRLANLVGCSVGSWPVKYLGRNTLRSAVWEPVVSKVARRLDG